MARERFTSIAEAADRFGLKPWEVVRLIESRRVEVVELVDTESLAAHLEGTR